ncbi:MAG: LacI family DNA-binding transcriptional regulator [Brotaphodocola sp.]
MGITIKEIAQMAGVHRSTVDKVLHNRPGVSEPVRQRIQKIIDECHYEANPIGKALQMQDKMLRLRALLLEVDAYEYLKSGIEEGMKNYASFQIEVDYRMTEYSDVVSQESELEQCIADKMDGVILSPINSPEIVEAINRCREAGIPVVTVNTDIKGSQRLCYIGQDGFKAGCVAGRLMGEFLQGKGKVAVFTSDSDNHQSFPFGTREGGFRSIIEERYPEIKLLPSIYTKEKAQIIYREMSWLCENIADLEGVFITCGGVKAVGDVLEEYDKQNIKVICFEKYPEIVDLIKRDIVLATLDSEIVEQGRQALEIMLDYLIYNKKPSRKHLYSEIKIILKECL